jgi:hypothetical protein
MDNPEKLATYGTRDKDKQNKNTTQYVLHMRTVANTLFLYHCKRTVGAKNSYSLSTNS